MEGHTWIISLKGGSYRYWDVRSSAARQKTHSRGSAIARPSLFGVFRFLEATELTLTAWFIRTGIAKVGNPLRHCLGNYILNGTVLRIVEP